MEIMSFTGPSSKNPVTTSVLYGIPCSVPNYEAIYREVTMSESARSDAETEPQAFFPKIHFALYDSKKNEEFKGNPNFITEEEAESEWVAKKISALIKNGRSPDEIAVLLGG